FGEDEVNQLLNAVEYYRTKKQDPPYQGYFEQEFCDAFSEFMGGGYADGVATGTAACYVALAALDLPPGSEVIISPVTDSGPLNCIILLGLVPVVADSGTDSYNIGIEQFLERVTPKTSALFAVHCAGEPLQIDILVTEARKRNIKVIEDCSQATGAMWKNQRIGSFGDIAAFSTMYRKTLTAGASSGIVYSNNERLYNQALAYADRGKPTWKNDINLNDPRNALFPSLNFNTDELSCAIGLASLERLQSSIDSRVAFVSKLIGSLESQSSLCTPYAFHHGFSPFFFPIFVDRTKLRCSKISFAEALIAEGINLSSDYGCLISSWSWASQYLSDNFVTRNALDTRDRSFNLFLNEQYGDEEILDIVAAIVKVESFFS
ncbi:TPA: glutamine--scyllo-inositol aminotransferase, partial [Candidatus Poribacteria bacterium]|nr:glutamine--scyllo-inositol aminotransferase [Candidatus Poribacteria bacterium]